jgi:hypothetical protein
MLQKNTRIVSNLKTQSVRSSIELIKVYRDHISKDVEGQER